MIGVAGKGEEARGKGEVLKCGSSKVRECGSVRVRECGSKKNTDTHIHTNPHTLEITGLNA